MYLLFLFISQQAASKINLISPSYLLVKRRKKHTNAYLQAALENAPWPFFFLNQDGINLKWETKEGRKHKHLR